jgi:hypothetical protein
MAWQIDKSHPAYLREVIQELQKAVGSFIYIGNNLHMSHTDFFKDLYNVALLDAKVAYDKAQELR